MTEYYVVYPCGDKLDLATDRKPVAIFVYESHADELVKKYGGLGEVKTVEKDELAEIIEELAQ
jgi:hypothetical protein